MPAEKTNKLNKKRFLRILVIVFAIVLPLFILVTSLLVFYLTKVSREGFGEMAEEKVDFLKPSEVLNNRLKYKDERLTLRGKVSWETMVCERKECSVEDSCCGCPLERDLIISDSEAVLIKETGWRLRLLGANGGAFCQREKGSCEYQCPGWEIGNVYDVRGVFRADPPPTGGGWRIYFDFYFEVEDQKLTKKTGITDLPAKILKGAQELIEEFKGAGSLYVLP